MYFTIAKTKRNSLERYDIRFAFAGFRFSKFVNFLGRLFKHLLNLFILEAFAILGALRLSNEHLEFVVFEKPRGKVRVAFLSRLLESLFELAQPVEFVVQVVEPSVLRLKI